MAVTSREMRFQSPEELTQHAEGFEFYTTLPLTGWLRTAKTMQSQVTTSEQQGDLSKAYMLATRHAILVIQKIPEYSKAEREKYKAEMKAAIKQVSVNLAKLEKWKPFIQAQYEKESQAYRAREATAIRRSQQMTQASLPTFDVENDDGFADDRRESLDDTEHRHVARELAQRALQQRRSDLIRRGHPDEHNDSVSAMLHTRKLLDGAATPMRSETKTSHAYHYPEVPIRRDTSWPSSPPALTGKTPPILPQKISLPIYSSPSTPTKPDKQPSSMPRPKFKIKAYTEGGEELRTVFLPSKLQAEFLNLADTNTRRDLETCGVLCASLTSNALMITHLVIPDQTSTSDTCDTTEEGDNALFDFCDQRNLIVCGWIHTHPSQTCFLSSRDLHTSSGYQMMLPEAIAIVCAPRHNPSSGIFRLTSPPGLPAVLKCQRKGLFHTHDETNLYTDAASPGHVVSDTNMQVEVVDLRSK